MRWSLLWTLLPDKALPLLLVGMGVASGRRFSSGPDTGGRRMPMRWRNLRVLVAVAAALLQPVAAVADVLVFCLDTSGSMQKQGRFDAAKSVLTQQIREARPGDVVYVIAFDSNDYPIGRLDVGEDGSPEAKEQLIAKLQGLKAKGRYTNLDEPLQAAKAFLLEERAPGARKILILSDGLSDPSPDHI
jgi:hypothetical protein